jgi:hypothetical protein
VEASAVTAADVPAAAVAAPAGSCTWALVAQTLDLAKFCRMAREDAPC